MTPKYPRLQILYFLKFFIITEYIKNYFYFSKLLHFQYFAVKEPI